MYYIIESDFPFKNIHSNFLKRTKFSYEASLADKIEEGESLKSMDQNLKIVFSEKEDTQLDFNNLFVPLVSENLKNILTALPENNFFEFYRVESYFLSSKIDKDFFVMNVLEIVDCLDYENSEYTKFEGTSVISNIQKMVIKKELTRSRNLFRVKERENLLVCSQIIVDLISKNDIKGMKFTPVEDYTED